MVTSNQLIIFGACLFFIGYSMEHHYPQWIISAWFGCLYGTLFSVAVNNWKRRNKRAKNNEPEA
jgi:hypothetical protein